jgi:hypothetical protein
MTDKGYGSSGPAIGPSGILMLGGRFADFIVSATAGKKWQLPSTQDGLDLSVISQKGISIRGETVLPDGTILAAQEYVGGSTRMLRFKVPGYPSLDALPFTKTDLVLQVGTYLGNGGIGASAVAVEYATGGNILVGLNNNITDVSGPAQLLLLNADASVVIASKRLPGVLAGIAKVLGPGTQVAFVTSTSVGVVEMVTGDVIWQVADAGATKSVDVSVDGQVMVVQSNKVVKLLNTADGALLREITLVRDYVTDVAISSTHGLFYVTGFDNKHLPSGAPVQVAWLVAYSIADGASRWMRFGFNGADLANSIADTRLYKVKLSGDGEHLDLMGESAGSQTIFRYNGLSWTGNVILTAIDFYNELWNTASAHITYTARVDAATGDIERAQLTMARLSDGKSNTFRNGDIASDEEGRLFFGGACTSAMAQRAALTVNGEAVGPYVAADPAFVALSPDFKARYTW